MKKVFSCPIKKSKTDFDYSGYEKSLEKLLSMIEKDYWTQYVDINKHQVSVSKTYLWVSVALLGAYITAYNHYSHLILLSSFTSIFFLCSFFSAAVSFAVCLYAIPARNGYMLIPEKGWTEFSYKAYQMLSKKEEGDVYITTLHDLITKAEKAVKHNQKTNKNRAKLLRITSWILLSSLIFCTLTVISLIIAHYIDLFDEEMLKCLTMMIKDLFQ